MPLCLAEMKVYAESAGLVLGEESSKRSGDNGCTVPGDVEFARLRLLLSSFHSFHGPSMEDRGR